MTAIHIVTLMDGDKDSPDILEEFEITSISLDDFIVQIGDILRLGTDFTNASEIKHFTVMFKDI